MSKLQSASALFAFISVTTLLFASQSGQAQSGTTNSGKTDSGAVHTITLPDIPPDIPPGPHVDAFERNCLTCHTARYVLIQPPFPKTVWENEVKKMIAAYGASISPQDQEHIVEYLDAVRGTGAKATTAPQK